MKDDANNVNEVEDCPLCLENPISRNGWFSGEVCDDCFNKYVSSYSDEAEAAVFRKAFLNAGGAIELVRDCKVCKSDVLCEHQRTQVVRQSILYLENSETYIGLRSTWSAARWRAVDDGINLRLDALECAVMQDFSVREDVT